MLDNLQRQQLRTEMRARRRALSEAQQHQAAISLATHVSHHLWFRQAKHVAFYLPNDGEISPIPLLQLSLALGKHCYLPAVMPSRRLVFRRYQMQQKLVANRFGILEPAQGAEYRPHWLLDLVLLPLVAYDRAGNRLGMGGGFYDRTFAARANQVRPLGKRLGLAHSCQQVSRLETAGWDVPVHAIATESRTRPI